MNTFPPVQIERSHVAHTPSPATGKGRAVHVHMLGTALMAAKLAYPMAGAVTDLNVSGVVTVAAVPEANGDRLTFQMSTGDGTVTASTLVTDMYIHHYTLAPDVSTA